jgi:hypothetical protein
LERIQGGTILQTGIILNADKMLALEALDVSNNIIPIIYFATV